MWAPTYDDTSGKVTANEQLVDAGVAVHSLPLFPHLAEEPSSPFRASLYFLRVIVSFFVFLIPSAIILNLEAKNLEALQGAHYIFWFLVSLQTIVSVIFTMAKPDIRKVVCDLWTCKCRNNTNHSDSSRMGFSGSSKLHPHDEEGGSSETKATESSAPTTIARGVASNSSLNNASSTFKLADEDDIPAFLGVLGQHDEVRFQNEGEHDQEGEVAVVSSSISEHVSVAVREF
jgi:hypothetical protein